MTGIPVIPAVKGLKSACILRYQELYRRTIELSLIRPSKFRTPLPASPVVLSSNNRPQIINEWDTKVPSFTCKKLAKLTLPIAEETNI